MFDVKGKAEVLHLNPRVEVHGDENVVAMDVKVMLLGVDVEKISTLCPDMKKRFYAGKLVAIGEVNPLTVCHKVENMRVKIGTLTFDGADVKKGAKIYLLPNHKADVQLAFQVKHRGTTIATLAEMLKTEVSVSVKEIQLKLADMEQTNQENQPAKPAAAAGAAAVH